MPEKIPALLEWSAATPKHSRRSISAWFRTHPDIADQVRQGLREGIAAARILTWLKQYHQWPFSSKTGPASLRDGVDGAE